MLLLMFILGIVTAYLFDQVRERQRRKIEARQRREAWINRN